MKLENYKEIVWCDLSCIAESDYEPDVVAKAKEYLSILDETNDEKVLDEMYYWAIENHVIPEE